MKNESILKRQFQEKSLHRRLLVVGKFFALFAIFALVSSCQLIEDLIDDNKVDKEQPRLALIAEGLTSPLTITEAPDGSGRLFIVDQIGVIHMVSADGKLYKEPFLDIKDKVIDLKEQYDERGLLGLAFHPQFSGNGRFFVFYSAPLRAEAPDDWDHTNYVSEFHVPSNSMKADPNSEKVILYQDHPYSNHNAGTLAFGPADGYLYISIGDGGNRDDQGRGHVDDWYEKNAGGNGQDVTQNLLGDILRIDVNGSSPYTIPADNPFVGKEGLDEIYAYGFRNPYKFSFDMGGSYQLFAGDAGQELWEEVSIVTKGGNYGWNVKEGTYCFDAADPENPPADCPDTDPEGDPLIDPVIQFKNAKHGGLGVVVVGGYIYRGKSLSQFNGKYIFGTFSASHHAPNGQVFVASPKPAGSGLWNFTQMKFANTPTGDLNSFLKGFGQNTEGEVFVLTSDQSGPTGNTGKAYKIATKK